MFDDPDQPMTIEDECEHCGDPGACKRYGGCMFHENCLDEVMEELFAEDGPTWDDLDSIWEPSNETDNGLDSQGDQLANADAQAHADAWRERLDNTDQQRER